MLQAEMVIVNTTEGAAYGAALLAAVGTGVFDSVEAACDAAIQITGKTSPGKDQEVYQAYYSTFRGLYPALKPTFHR